jgi:hypothetical protein
MEEAQAQESELLATDSFRVERIKESPSDDGYRFHIWTSKYPGFLFDARPTMGTRDIYGLENYSFDTRVLPLLKAGDLVEVTYIKSTGRMVRVRLMQSADNPPTPPEGASFSGEKR